MNTTEVFQLDIWRGDWGLPSIDTECLQVLAYAKFSEAPLEINATSNPFRTPNGKLPILKTKDHNLNTVKDIVQFLRKRDYTPDSTLNSKQCSEIIAYDTMLKEMLYPGLKFIWWVDERNLNELARPWYCKALPFPLNYYYPGRFERQARIMMDTLHPMEDNIIAIETKVYSEAQKCLTLLSTRLGEADFFFGSQPTTLDAIIYSYLAPLLKAPFPNPALQNHLKACTNLTMFISRISHRYFENEYQSYEKLKSEQNAQKARNNFESDFPNKRMHQIIAGLFATVVMTGYALSTGILKVTKNEDDVLDMPSEYAADDDDDVYE